MRLTIHPDAQEPAGGFAFLELPADTLGKGPVHVAVMEVYGERWLGPPEAAPHAGAKIGAKVGDTNWQGERYEFGPYAVHAHDGADWVRIGPEIVNKIEEYTPLRLFVGAHVADVSWPDDVPPRAGAAVLGGLQATARALPQDAGGTLIGRLADTGTDTGAEPEEPAPEPAPKPPEAVPETVPEPAPDAADTPKQRRALWQPLLLLVLLIVLAAVAWALVLREDTPADDPVDTPVVAGKDSCTHEALIALGSFAATEKAIRACGDALSPDTVLKIVEDGAQQGDPGALLLFGTLYDGAQVDARIEKVIGLSFEHDAARAAEYYARAVAAGSDLARARLAATCAQLAGSNDTLAKGAHDDYCR